MVAKIYTDHEGLVDIARGSREPAPPFKPGEHSIDLEGLLDLIHDRYFDLDELVFDRETGEASLYLTDNRRARHGRKTLTVTDVKDISIEDTERIGIYDLNYVELAEASVRLVSHFPLQIELSVGEDCTIRVLHDAPPERYARLAPAGPSLLRRVTSLFRR